MKKTIFLTALLTSNIAGLFSQTTVTLTPTQDAPIGYHDGAGTAGNNYGSGIQAAAYCIPAVASSGVNLNRALMQFNFNSLPPGAVIISAYMNLYATGPLGSLPGHTGSNASYLERITQSWGEFTVTWNNQPTTTNQNSIVLPQSTSSTQDYLNINVLPLVQDMINNPSASFGFELKLINESVTNALLFYSKDNGNPAKVPTLVITYSISTVGLNNNSYEDDNNITIYPNPSLNTVSIDYDVEGQQTPQLNIVNIEGKSLKQYSLDVNKRSFEISVIDLNPGIYFCQILSNGTITSSKKLIITK